MYLSFKLLIQENNTLCLIWNSLYGVVWTAYTEEYYAVLGVTERLAFKDPGLILS